VPEPEPTDDAARPQNDARQEPPEAEGPPLHAATDSAAESAAAVAQIAAATVADSDDVLPDAGPDTSPEIFVEPAEEQSVVTTTPRTELASLIAAPAQRRARRVAPLPALATGLAVVAALAVGGYFLLGQDDEEPTETAQTPPVNSLAPPAITAIAPPVAPPPAPSPAAPAPASPPPQVATAPALPPGIPAPRPGVQPSLLVPPFESDSDTPYAAAAPPSADFSSHPPAPPQAIDKESIASLITRADGGDAEAAIELGKRYMQGIGTEKNPAEALRWLEKAATAGNGQAQFNVGVMYERGIGTAADLPKAVGWYRKAAAQPIPVPTAIHNLALLYVAGGPGGTADPAQARITMTRAAELGLPESEYSLALMYYQGVGGPPDKIMALSWLALAARTNNPQLTKAAQQLASGMSDDEKAKAQQIANEHVKRINNNIAHLRALASAGKPDAAGANPPEAALDKAGIAELQKLLAALKLYTGTVDGSNGPRTEQAIRDYQAMAGLTVDGKATPDLLAGLRDVAGAVTPKEK
jgi:localization factor PodJL